MTVVTKSFIADILYHCKVLSSYLSQVREDTVITRSLFKHPEAAPSIVRDGKSIMKGGLGTMGVHVRFCSLASCGHFIDCIYRIQHNQGGSE